MKSKIVLFLCFIAMTYGSFVFSPRWSKPAGNAAIAYDVAGYYWYLPSIFIYHDLKKQNFKDSLLTKYQTIDGGTEIGIRLPKTGNYVLKYSSGMAILYSPFFFAAHFLAPFFRYPADGLSAPYQVAIQLGGLLFTFLGLWYFRKFLRQYHSDAAVTITLLAVLFGTYLFNYGAIDTGMSHAWLFTIYVFIIISTDAFYKKPSNKNAILLGLLIGFATLTRPNEIVSLLIPLFWGMEGMSLSAFKKQFQFLRTHAKRIFTCFLSGATVFSIQLFYWKYVSGNWLFYSYGGEEFNFKNPEIYHYIFGPQNGWWQYAPICGLCFLSLLFFIKKKNFVSILIFQLVFVYLISCWDVYWYGGRFMVETLAVLFLPFATGIDWLFTKKIGLKMLFFTLIIGFVYIGFWANIILHYGNAGEFENTSSNYYYASIGQFYVNESMIKLRDKNEVFTGEPESIDTLYRNDFEQDSLTENVHPIDGMKSFFFG